MRDRIKIVQIPAGSTRQQIEDGINTALSRGWKFVQFIQVGANMFVVLQKVFIQ